jgi:hypothetical protein
VVSLVEQELSAAVAIAVTYMKEGRSKADAIELAMRFLNWKPDTISAERVSEAMKNGADKERADIHDRIRFIRRGPDR